MSWTEQVKFNKKHVEWGLQLSEMMSEYASMWDGHLKKKSVANHYINLNPPNAPPNNAAPYRAGPQQRQLEKEELEQILKVCKAGPNTTEWASPLVFVPKKDRSLRFWVDHRRLNAVTVGESYAISKMDE